ncbi:MAG: hypothetical protein HN846_03075 [Candidatus Pacebacteria bacterium]|jgi:mannosyltransferase|nr:hypothetical protein [Candidatus Paceibacterota bacterium]MBT4005103.1 hypothetical protein [Candidatus Paceibacterota bacterium]MBT4358916.1 hypothetical protein [Candidatus Paceibacterota bacterium]MBT4680785.1 hypothetical protein [Candidatus Paceibacterota bacterium]MBT6898784.1 hypothetical protein [Candidatus Paceibacterota bacterium]
MLKTLLTQNYITRGFWGDEAWTAVISKLSIPEIIQVTGQDFHPPLYYFIVHGFMQVFGESEWIRILSTIFFILTLIPVYFFAKKIANKTVAWVSTVLVAFSPILFIYAFEARSYAFLTLMSVLSTFCFWKAVSLSKNRKKPTAETIKFWIIYAILGGFGVYTHYYMWFILASHGVYWLLVDRRQFKQVFMSYLFIFLAQLPWIPTLFAQVKTVAGDYWIGGMNSRTHAEYFMRITAGDIVTPWQTMLSKVMFAALLISPVLVFFKSKRQLPRPYIFLWSWLVVPVLIPTLMSFLTPVFFYRYLVFTSVPIILITAWGLSALKKELLYALAALLLVFYVKTDYRIFDRFPRSMREELGAAFEAEQAPSEEAPIFTYLPSFAEVYYYTYQQAPVKVVPLGLVRFSGKSLLDKYVEKGLVEIVEPAEGQVYWELEKGPTSEFHGN